MDQVSGRERMSRIDSSRSSCDIVVVGGGPAGSAAAICCAQAGLDVVLTERESFPRDCPGETVHPGIEPLLKELGVLDDVLSAGFLRHSGNWVSWNNVLQFIPFGADEKGDWRGFQIWRPVFDTILLNHAKKSGVRIVQPCQVFGPIVTEETGRRVTGVTTSEGSFKSSFVVDAAGGKHWIAGRLGIDILKFSPRLIAHYGYASGNARCDRNPSIVADEQGWMWIAQVRLNLYQWTRLSFNAGSAKKGAIPDDLKHLEQIGETRGRDVTWRVASKPAGDGYFMVGDAAAVIDPASSHGVIRAIMSGIMVGHLIKGLRRNMWTESVATSAYCNWMRNWFNHDARVLRELYAKHPRPPQWL